MELNAKAVEFSRIGAVARVRLARPETGNALDADMVTEIAAAVRAASTAPDCRALVLEAMGTRFCTGAHVAASEVEGGEVPSESVLRAFVDCLALLCQAPVPTIACVEGDAMGGGVGLAAACDVVLASAEARFMLSEIILGMIPALIAPVLLRRLSPGKLRYLMLSSRALPAAEAQIIGLADEIVPTGHMRQALSQQLDRIGRSAPPAIAVGKAFLDDLAGNDWDSRVDTAIELQRAWLQRVEVREGLRAFAEGFSPPWFERMGRTYTVACEEQDQ